MRTRLRTGITTLLFVLSFGIISATTNPADTTELRAKPVYGKEAKIIAHILDNNHYRKIRLNDSLSSVILDKYIENLDNNKTYFTKADIASFEKYRKQIDDLTRAEDVSVAYEIYKVFRKRFEERMVHVKKEVIDKEFDFSINEYVETDRDREGWAATNAALNEIWRMQIKSQALSLKLAGKTQAEISKTLHERYDRFIKSVRQFNSEDVFGV